MITIIKDSFYSKLAQIPPKVRKAGITVSLQINTQENTKIELDVPATSETIIDDIPIQIESETGLIRQQINNLQIISCKPRKELTAEMLAEELDGRQYREEITRWEASRAKDNNLLVIFCASDDLMILDGAVTDEIGAEDDRTIYLTRRGKVKKNNRKNRLAIHVVWDGYTETQAPWQVWTESKHHKFTIYEDGAPYCIGAVIDMDEAFKKKIKKSIVEQTHYF